MEKGAKKPGLKTSDVVVTRVARLLWQLRVWVLVGTVLTICMIVYAFAWFLKRH